jgi:GTP pyrophosphokinase
VLGVGDLLTRIALCCNPIPGDEIKGFVTRTRGVTVHKRDCSSLKNEDEPERIVPVSWGVLRELYPVRVCIEAYDRVGLLRDVTMRVSEEHVNIASVVTVENDDGTVTMELTLHTTGLDQLGKLFSKLEGVKSVISVIRVRSSLPTAAIKG